MSTYTQSHRLISVHTPLGEDVLLLQSFSGQEGVSELFRFDLKMHSLNRSVSFDSVVGKPATVRVMLDGGEERFINGVVSSFSQAGTSGGLAHYHATLVPWFWLLTRTSDCRIFQQMPVPDIIEKIFQERSFKDYSLRLHGSFQPREYCVQYRETTFNFVSRLMQEEGIFYFFEHTKDKHTLVLANSPNEFKPCPNQTAARYEAALGVGRNEDVVSEWSFGQEVRPGKYTASDFNFETPMLDLTAQVTGRDEREYEIYDYPGEYATKDEGEQLVGVRMQEEDSPRLAAAGTGTCRAFTPGYRFDLKEHYRRDANKAYAILSVFHSVEHGMNFRSGSDASDEFAYLNHFQCVPHPTPFRPPRTAPVPVVHGTQTAIVVGPAGEEIYTDKYGRVKVQFHWDREGKYDEKSSCWVRVSQNWAGKRWGAMFIPRVGQEVIVDFIEGDPDRPIITGRVYNAALMPPYALPGEKTKSTIKTNSSKGGGGFNEIRFEDKKGSEQIFVHAERDEHVRIKNDRVEWVGNDSHLMVKHDQLESVDGDKHLAVKGDQNEKVDGGYSLKVGQDTQTKTGMKFAVDAGQEVHLKAGMNVVIEAGMSITLKAGGGFVVVGPAGVTISGNPVLINSGGAAGAGSGSSPQPPTAPKEADKAEPGQAPEMPPKKAPAKPKQYGPAAIMMKEAAQNGTPFCDL
ncbi:MAG: type VI secretion system tip protein TssI/VgrG [Pyrinomonadaceae bacterium]